MELKDRELLMELMQEQGVSGRELARFAGWKSHTYLQRLLREGGPKTLETDPAIRIAFRLGMPVNRLFVTRASGDRAQPIAMRRP